MATQDLMAQGVLLGVSHIFIVPLIAVSYFQGMWLLLIVACIELFNSLTYHVCDWYGACLFSYTMHRLLDYVFATYFIPLIALEQIYWRDRADYAARGVGAPWLHKIWAVFLGFMVAVATLVTGGNAVSQAIVLGVTAVVLLGYWSVYGCIYRSFPRYKWSWFFLGTVYIELGLLMFVIDAASPQLFGYTHSMWHALVFTGTAYMAATKPPVPHFLNAERKIERLVIV